MRPVWSAQQDPAGEEEKGGEIPFFAPFLGSYILLQTQWAPPRIVLSSHQNSASGITSAEAIPWLLCTLQPSHPSLTTPPWPYLRAPHSYYILLLPYLVLALSHVYSDPDLEHFALTFWLCDVHF